MTFHLVRRLATKRELNPYNLKEDTQSKLSDERKDALTKVIAEKEAERAQQRSQLKEANLGKIVQVCFCNFCLSYFFGYEKKLKELRLLVPSSMSNLQDIFQTF